MLAGEMVRVILMAARVFAGMKMEEVFESDASFKALLMEKLSYFRIQWWILPRDLTSIPDKIQRGKLNCRGWEERVRGFL